MTTKRNSFHKAVKGLYEYFGAFLLNEAGDAEGMLSSLAGLIGAGAAYVLRRNGDDLDVLSKLEISMNPLVVAYDLDSWLAETEDVSVYTLDGRKAIVVRGLPTPKGELFTVLFVEDEVELNKNTLRELEVAGFLTSLAVAWHEKRLSERRELKRIQDIHALAARLSRHMVTFELFLQYLVEEAISMFAGGAATLYVWDDRKRYLMSRFSEGVSFQYMRYQKISSHSINDYLTYSNGNPFIVKRDELARLYEESGLASEEGITEVLGIPLTSEEGLAAFLAVCKKGGGQPFTEDDLHVAKMFSGEASIAFRNADLYHEATYSQRLSRMLLEVSALLGSVSKVDAVFQQIARLVTYRAPLALVSIMLKSDEESEDLKVVAHEQREGVDSVPGLEPGGTFALSEWPSVLQRFEKSNKPIFVTRQDAERLHMAQEVFKTTPPQIFTAAVVPIEVMGRLRGWMLLGDRRSDARHNLRPAMLTATSAIAQHIGLAIARAQSLGQLEERTKALEEWQKVVSRALPEVDPDEMLDTLTSGVLELSGATQVGVHLFRSGTFYRRIVKSTSGRAPDFEHIEYLMLESAQERAIKKWEREGVKGLSWGNVLAIPMLWNGRLLGMLSLACDPPCDFNAEKVKLYQTIADALASFIANLPTEKPKSLSTAMLGSEISRMISGGLPKTAEEISNVFGWKKVAIAVSGEDGVASFSAVSGAALPNETISLNFECLEEAAPKVGNSYLVNGALWKKCIGDIETFIGFVGMESGEEWTPQGAVLLVPIVRNGETLGVILFNDHQSGRFPKETDVKVLEQISLLVALMIADEKKPALWELNSDVFLPITSHSLRNHLSFIKGYLELFGSGRLGDLSEEQRNALKVMSSRAERAVAELEKAKVGFPKSFEKTELPLTEIVKTSVESISPLAENKGIDVHVSVDEAEEVTVLGNRELLLHAVDNVLDNAVKFSPHGGKIDVGISKSGGWVEISVSDTGPGIPEEKLEEIFEPFYSEGEPKGLGVGLALARKIVEAHGGKIWAESDGKTGTTLIMRFPL